MITNSAINENPFDCLVIFMIANEIEIHIRNALFRSSNNRSFRFRYTHRHFAQAIASRNISVTGIIIKRIIIASSAPEIARLRNDKLVSFGCVPFESVNKWWLWIFCQAITLKIIACLNQWWCDKSTNVRIQMEMKNEKVFFETNFPESLPSFLEFSTGNSRKL